MMTRDDYWELANALAMRPNIEVKYRLVLKLCDLLKADNPQFDLDTFLDASEKKEVPDA